MTIEGLKTAERKVVHSSDVAGRCCNVWAPETYYLDGTWYFLTAALRLGMTTHMLASSLKNGPSVGQLCDLMSLRIIWRTPASTGCNTIAVHTEPREQRVATREYWSYRKVDGGVGAQRHAG
ncbi:hypothetical protein F5Y05DRAFT_364121 [Hypoxylon sp. FL0543]|nr:hypothetical protein F5Y05DRAFT_364121 [Hypoxylon sp. FL0543]